MNNPICVYGKVIIEGRGLPALVFALQSHLNFANLTFHNKSRSLGIFFANKFII